MSGEPTPERFFEDGFEYVGQASICHYCNHRTGKRKCTAFPKGIPEAFWTGAADHTTPYAGDNGTTFEPRSS